MLTASVFSIHNIRISKFEFWLRTRPKAAQSNNPNKLYLRIRSLNVQGLWQVLLSRHTLLIFKRSRFKTTKYANIGLYAIKSILSMTAFSNCAISETNIIIICTHVDRFSYIFIRARVHNRLFSLTLVQSRFQFALVSSWSSSSQLCKSAEWDILLSSSADKVLRQHFFSGIKFAMKNSVCLWARALSIGSVDQSTSGVANEQLWKMAAENSFV